MRRSAPERLRVELQRPYLPEDRARNRRLAWLARRLELRCVSTGNVHAHTRARAPLQDAFVAICACTRRSMPQSPSGAATSATCWPRPAAMAARFPEYPEAVAETARLGRVAALRPHQRPLLQLSRRRGSAQAARAQRALQRAPARALQATSRARPRRGRGAARAGAADHREAQPGRLLRAAPRDARAGAGGGGRGARPRCEHTDGANPRARCCRRDAGAARACPRSSVT